MHVFHPDLAAARFIPRFSIGPLSSSLARSRTPRVRSAPADVSVHEHTVLGPQGSGPVTMRVYQPAGLRSPAPALVWMHGGGMVLGSPEQDEQGSIELVRELGITVAAVRYRLALSHPAPAAVEDVVAGYLGLRAQAAQLNVDVNRIAVGGASAGGGLAAGAALMIRDRGIPLPVLQLLIYPMLDDRTVTRRDVDAATLRMWSTKSNRYGWTTYLGGEPGGETVSYYAAPARSTQLADLPPAWIGVGSLDLFHDEDVQYARRLAAAGTPSELLVVPGAFHAFDTVFPRAGVVREFRAAQIRALRGAFGLAEGMPQE